MAEASLSNCHVEAIHECKSAVFPMVKHPFVVGFLVAEFPMMECETCNNAGGDDQDFELCTSPDHYPLPLHIEKRRWDIQSLKEDSSRKFQRFTAEQKSSVVNTSRALAMAYVVDQISYDIIEDILVQGDRMRDTLQQLQDAVYFRKANIDKAKQLHQTYPLSSAAKDLEMLMPPLALAPL